MENYKSMEHFNFFPFSPMKRKKKVKTEDNLALNDLIKENNHLLGIKNKFTIMVKKLIKKKIISSNLNLRKIE